MTTLSAARLKYKFKGPISFLHAAGSLPIKLNKNLNTGEINVPYRNTQVMHQVYFKRTIKTSLDFRKKKPQTKRGH